MRGRWGEFDRDEGRCGILERLTEPSLVLYIFSFLDLQDLFRLRAVCKSWYDAVLSPAFLRLYKTPLEPWAVLRVRTELPSDSELRYDDDHFDYGMKLRNHTELWRPRSFQQRTKINLPLGPPGSQFIGLCSSNGLVCGMLMEHKDSVTLAVGNPITNVWKVLPPVPIPFRERPRPAYLDVYMEVETEVDVCSYRIAVLYPKPPDEHPSVEDEDDRIFSLQYESSSCSWEEGPVFTVSDSMGSTLRGCAFYYTGEDVFPVYDARTRAWSHHDVSRPTRPDQDDEGSWANWAFGYIGAFTYKGKYYWASLLYDHVERLGQDIGVAIWELKQENSTWILVTRILSTDLIGANCCLTVDEKNLKVWLVGDMVFISTVYRKESYGVWPPVAYDFALSKWFTCYEEGAEGDVECSYVVVPSLTATP